MILLGRQVVLLKFMHAQKNALDFHRLHFILLQSHQIKLQHPITEQISAHHEQVDTILNDE